MLLLNLVHRPELAPEYALNGAQVTKANIEKQSLDIFLLQQDIAHKNGLKTTIQMTYAALFSPEAVAIAKDHHQRFGDEIAVTFLGLDCPAFQDKFQTRDFCIWMFAKSDKKQIVHDVFEKFYSLFGFYPTATGSYFMDADLINIVKEKYPMVEAVVATCFEEGPKAYHTTNNSWYTFMDGGPWNPWIPSKINSHIPASNIENDAGVVAIPHLSRDLNACFDGNGSNFGTHPQNVLRGMIYQDGQYPYLFNLIDQYHHLAKYNNGYAYNMMFVGPGWLNPQGRWEAPFSLLKKSYEDALSYYGEMQKRGELKSLGMSEFARLYREKHQYQEPEVALWNDILYGGGKQYFWYYNPHFRLLFDLNQGGALIDFRPYAGQLYQPVGIGTPNIVNASYPFIVQAHYRAGFFTHYAGEGTIKSARVTYEGETVDLALTRTKGHVKRFDRKEILQLEPVNLVFKNLTLTLVTIITIDDNLAQINTERTIVKISDLNAKVEIEEYLTGSYGTTEYPENMYPLKLFVENEEETQMLNYAYQDRKITCAQGRAIVDIPPLNVRVIHSGKDVLSSYAHEGYAFSPMFTLGVKKMVGIKEMMSTWLKLEKKN